MASSVCKSLQYLTSSLTQGSKGGHLFRLSCLLVLLGGRNTANKYHWHVQSAFYIWATLGLPPLTVCVLSWSTLFRFQVALQGNCLRPSLGCVHFPGLRHSGSGSRVLHKGTELGGPGFCALPRSEQLRRPGAWRVHSPQVGRCILSSPRFQMFSFLGAQRERCLSCAMCLLWGADLWL